MYAGGEAHGHPSHVRWEFGRTRRAEVCKSKQVSSCKQGHIRRANAHSEVVQVGQKKGGQADVSSCSLALLTTCDDKFQILRKDQRFPVANLQ